MMINTKFYSIKLFIIILTVQVFSVSLRPQISLEYKPMRPWHRPTGGNHIGAQIIPPGNPWPANKEEYDKFSQTSSLPDNQTPGTLENRFQQTTTSNNATTTLPSSIVLGSEIIRPGYHPSGGILGGQRIPPGKPWPANKEDYDKFSQTSLSSNQTPGTLENRFQETTNSPSGIIGSSTNGPSSSPPTSFVLGSEVIRPGYHPSGGNLNAQIVPPGKPWPASEEDYVSFGQTTSLPNSGPNLENRFQENNKTTSTKPPKPDTQPSIVLEYKPMRPSYRPTGGNHIGAQIVPPGKPWPANKEDYDKFSQTSSLPANQTPGTLENRFQETTSSNQATSSHPQSIVLGSEIIRPGFHPSGGTLSGQRIPPGKPWPANPEDYASFSQTTNLPKTPNISLKNRLDEIAVSTEETSKDNDRTVSTSESDSSLLTTLFGTETASENDNLNNEDTATTSVQETTRDTLDTTNTSLKLKLFTSAIKTITETSTQTTPEQKTVSNVSTTNATNAVLDSVSDLLSNDAQEVLDDNLKEASKEQNNTTLLQMEASETAAKEDLEEVLTTTVTNVIDWDASDKLLSNSGDILTTEKKILQDATEKSIRNRGKSFSNKESDILLPEKSPSLLDNDLFYMKRIQRIPDSRKLKKIFVNIETIGFVEPSFNFHSFTPFHGYRNLNYHNY